MNKTERLSVAKALRTAAAKLMGAKGNPLANVPMTPAAKHIIDNPRDLSWAEDEQLQAALMFAEDLPGGKANAARALIRKELSARGVSASVVKGKFTVLLLGYKAGTAETLAEVPGPDAKRAVQQALKLVVDPSFDLSLPENKPKLKIEQLQPLGGGPPVDVAWVSFDRFTNFIVLPQEYAKNWEQIGIRQGGQPLGAKTKVKAAGGKYAVEVEGSATVKAVSGVKVEKPGQLRDGIWEGESISFIVSLSEFLEALDLDHVAKWVKDGSVEVYDAPPARDLADYGKKTSSEAITCFPDAASHAYMTAMESGIEAYRAKHYSEGVIDLINEIDGTADYEGEDSNGEPAVVKQKYSVTAEETGDVDGIYSDPYIKITVDEPVHFANGPLADLRITSPQSVDESYGDVPLTGDIAAYLKEDFSREVKNIGESDDSNADMDKDVFDEFFVQNVLEMDPGEIAEAIQTYADDNEESVEDVVDQMMKDIPGLDKLSGAIASALEGGYDARQQKLPLKGALKALANAQKAIEAASNPIANIREKRSAAAKRGDSKAVSYWSAKLRTALSKGPAPSSTTKSKIASKAIKAAKKFSMCPVCEAGFPVSPGEPLPQHSFLRKPCSGSGQAGVSGSALEAARKPSAAQQKKLNDKRIEKAYYKVADGVQINMMDIPRVFKAGEKALAEGADDAALEKAISDFVQTIRMN